MTGLPVVSSLNLFMSAGSFHGIEFSEPMTRFLPTANRMYLTFIDKEFEGDAYFPEYSEHEWKETSREEHVDENGLKYSFVNFERVKS